MKASPIKKEYRVILGMIKPGSSVLDLGCGDGELMSVLVSERNARVQGIEINEQAIRKCVARGLSVFQGDIDSGLTDFNDKSFDYVILDQSLQQVKMPDVVLKEALRVGRQVIVGFPNFAHYSARFQLAVKGRAPITNSLPYEWHDTPNVHFLSIRDFFQYCSTRQIRIEESCFISRGRMVKFLPNLFALIGIFLITANNKGA
jgi:methionine biosynthesis protein MetW